MNYFDIFRIPYEDLTLIAMNPELVVTSVSETEDGYKGEIRLTGEYPDREDPVLYFHKNGFENVQDAYDDLDQMMDTIKVAFQNTKKSEAIRRDNLL